MPKGRPVGHVLSVQTKQKISISKTGQVHSEETKQKIAEGVSRFFDLNPTPAIIEKNRQLMCMTPLKVKTSIKAMQWWIDHPEAREKQSIRMREYHANK